MTVSIAPADFTIAAVGARWGAHPVDALATTESRWRFGLWAPDIAEAALLLGGATIPAEPAGDGWWQVETQADPGMSYLWRLDGRDRPDPAARVQAGDVHGPSLLTDFRALSAASAASAADRDWQGIAWGNAVIYELHLGTFTPTGTLAAAIRELPRLKSLG
ncbi:hypothetical protein [Novosphingobium sp. 9]|uniref:hypothetical protein n=1 Tax=Novosphingobium sp. 9 TaxID=2025349 RepID=UPI0021B5521B|nr:hypothetical protein [Novosphingobium sp. 9]